MLISVSNRPFKIVSPYGSSVAFDPMVDHWQGEWRGPIEGFRKLDPDGEGILDHRWTGTAILRIDSTDWSEVKFLLTGANYMTVEGSKSGVGVDNIPQVEMSAPVPWTSKLSEVQGQKGYFEGNSMGTVWTFKWYPVLSMIGLATSQHSLHKSNEDNKSGIKN